MSVIAKQQPEQENKAALTSSYSSEHLLQEKKVLKNPKLYEIVMHCLVYFYVQICTWIIVKFILFQNFIVFCRHLVFPVR